MTFVPPAAFESNKRGVVATDPETTAYWERVTKMWTEQEVHTLPPETRKVVEAEIAWAEANNEVYTPLRPFMPGEPNSPRVGCEGYWPTNEKGKVWACEGKTAYIRYFHFGRSQQMCSECYTKYSTPGFDWETVPFYEGK